MGLGGLRGLGDSGGSGSRVPGFQQGLGVSAEGVGLGCKV